MSSNFSSFCEEWLKSIPPLKTTKVGHPKAFERLPPCFVALTQFNTPSASSDAVRKLRNEKLGK
jgi:hypothetical protein